jgi:hypothetical protein
LAQLTVKLATGGLLVGGGGAAIVTVEVDELVAFVASVTVSVTVYVPAA